ncbi:hypothetical protein ACTFIU_003203 [Dictyostelium citrinum]
MKNHFYFLILFCLTFYIQFSQSQTIEEYNCLVNIITKFNLTVNYQKNATGGYNLCSGSGSITCSNGVVNTISITAFNEYPPASAILTPQELVCLPNLVYIKLEHLRVNTDFLFTKFGKVSQITIQNVPKGAVDINQVDRPFPTYDYYFLSCPEFNNSILYSSYLNNVRSFYIQSSFVTFTINAGTNFTNLRTLYLWSLNIPDLSSYTSISSTYLVLRSDYDKSTISNYANIKSSTIQITFPASSPAIPSIIEMNRYATSVSIYSQTFSKPSSIIDMSTGYNLKQVYLNGVGADFNVGGEFPMTFSKTMNSVYVSGGSFKTAPAYSNVTTGTLTVVNSGLTDLPTYAGSARVLDYTNNALTGTIDKSYCDVELIVATNKLTGTIPTCYTCYFGFPITPTVGSWSKTPFYNRFSGNQFSNYVSNPGCTTFAPQVRANSDLSGFIVSGTDIGWEGAPYSINGSPCPNADRTAGDITCRITANFLKGVKYASIFNSWHNKNYTFSFISSPPDASAVSISTNTLSIDGTYFSSYLGQSIQSVKVANVDCTIGSTDFFKIVCTTVSTIPSSASASQLLTIATANQTKKFYIQTSNGFKNSKTCPNDCSTNSRGICDLSSGTCVCNNGFGGIDCSEIPCPTFNSLPCNGSPNTCNTTDGTCKCSGRNFGLDCSSIQCVDPTCSNFGTCDTTSGSCKCDQSHQGSDCSLPFLDCPIYQSLKCNGGSCNNQTGVCTCDSSHQGSDCSLPLVQCPTYNSLPCNGIAGTCNNQTGICTCNSSHQGKNCSLPLVQCPIYNSLTCNGITGACNNQTGICTCDSSHQGSDCSLPLVQCPIYNFLACNGIAGTCNNQTGICTCDSSHQGSDCSLPLIQCPIYNSLSCNGIAGTCNNQTGLCSCDSSHQGSDCSLPLIECPIYNSLSCNGVAGTCNNQTGLCTCDSSHQGSDCSLPLVQCPIYNSLACNGIAGSCNNQTGLCTCDSSYQGSDCSLPHVECPIYNSLACNGIAGTCNNQTGVCTCNGQSAGEDCSGVQCFDPTCSGSGICDITTGTCDCDSSHQGIDCSLPFVECPTFNSLPCNGGSNQCNNQTGTCNCDSSHYGSDCSLSYIECPNDCSGNGICDRTKGKCQCTPGKFIGEDCSIIYHYVTSVTESSTKGGLASFYGAFGKDHELLTIKIGGLNCEIDKISDNQIDCIAPAGTGIKSINVTQNGVSYFKNNYYKYKVIDAVLQCPKDCSGAKNGICNTTTGQCTCINGYGSHDCSELSNNNGNNENSNSDSDSELPPNVIVVDPGKTNITNGEINFLIYIKSVTEVDYDGNVLKTFKLDNVWEKVNSTDSNTYIYKQTLDNTECVIESKIEEITDRNGKLFSFADVDFKVESGSVKFSISVSNYTYISNLNNLQIELVSETSQIVQDSNSCNEEDTSLDTSDFNSESNLNYIKISKNNKVLSGRFINKVISDGKVTFLDSIATKSTSDSISITLNLPHCTSQCLVDPDFSVLLSSDFKSECGGKDDKKSYVIPVAVVASVVGVGAMGAAGFVIYKKKFIEGPLKKKLTRSS